MSRTVRCAAVCAAAFFATVPPAFAAPAPPASAPPTAAAEKPTARAYFNAGARAYAAGRYPAAIRAFEEAYALEPRPGLLFSVAQAHRRQYFIDKSPDALRSAIRHYRRYLEADPDGARRGDSAAALSELEPYAAKLPGGEDAPALTPQKPATQLMISSPVDDVSITVDGAPAGTLPYIASVTPGEHRITLTAAGYLPYERVVRVLDGSVVPLDLPLEEKPARLAVQTMSGARISVDGRLRGEAPLPPIALPPGRHYVTVTANGHSPYSSEVELDRDQRVSLNADLPTTGQRAAAWLFIGMGGAAVLAGGGLFTVAAIRESDAKNMQVDSPEDIRHYNDTLALRDELRTAGIVSTAAGVGVATIGLVLFAFDEPRPEGPAPSERGPAAPRRPGDAAPSLEVSAAPFVAPGGGGAVIGGLF
jgi:hypothetical protein